VQSCGWTAARGCRRGRPVHDRLVTNWLLLHGTPLTPAVWDGVRPLLGGVVTAPNLSPGGQPSMSGAQRAIAGRLGATPAGGDPPWHVVGHSFGGQVALELAIQSPQLVSKLTLLCTRDTPYPPFARGATDIAAEPLDVDATLRRWFGPDELRADGPVVRYVRSTLGSADRSVWANALSAIAVFDCSAETTSIRCPTTVIAAAHDQVSTPEAMRGMCSRISGARFVVLDDAWHMSIFTDPANLAALLRLEPTPV
jgi:3-oxoadipate enol-lactonase